MRGKKNTKTTEKARMRVQEGLAGLAGVRVSGGGPEGVQGGVRGFGAEKLKTRRNSVASLLRSNIVGQMAQGTPVPAVPTPPPPISRC